MNELERENLYLRAKLEEVMKERDELKAKLEELTGNHVTEAVEEWFMRGFY